MDYARHRDFSIICPMSVDQSRHRDIPFVVELHKVPTRQQKQILFYILRGLPRFIGAALDATGNGETLAEETADEFGRNRIQQVKINRAWYGAWMPKFIQLFEDASLTLPRDDTLHQDIRAIETIDGIPMIAKARQQDLKDPDLHRHGDFAGAGALAERQRASENDGLCLGLDAANLAEAFAAGNAVVPQIAQWIAEKLIKAT
jgi:phage FluMu gp28-like protein